MTIDIIGRCVAGNEFSGLTSPDIAVHFRARSRNVGVSWRVMSYSEVHEVLSALVSRVEILAVHMEAGLLLSMYK